MHIFSFNENQKPYVYPILKIVISVALIVIVFFVRFHFSIENDIVNVVTGVASVAVFVAGLQCIFRSVAEIEDIRENRTIQVKANEKVKAKYKAVPDDKIVSLVKNNDIIAIKIVSGEKVVEIGASADCKRGSSMFFDKLYYIDDNEFPDIDDFVREVRKYSDAGMLKVFSIDDCPPEVYGLKGLEHDE